MGPVVGEKKCTKCHTIKRFDEFAKASQHKHGLGSWCRICKNKRTSEIYYSDVAHGRKFRADWRRENPGYHLRHYWPGSTSAKAFEKYSEFLTAQGGVCAVCHRPEKHRHFKSGEIRNLSVDHCHKTGRVRGLLCSECNRALGAFEDKTELFTRIIEYLAKTEGHS